MKQMEMFAKARKQEKLEQVAMNAQPWFDRALALAASIAETFYDSKVTGEEMRAMIAVRIGPPHHHNAWGAVIANVVRRGYLVPTGRWVPMKGPKSNARRTPEYRLARP